MPDTFLSLTPELRREALEAAAHADGRPAYLHEKDIWVVWVLETLFGGPFATDLVFKGGTSLSKAYGVIDRFSEDVDLTYDIRKLAPDVANADNPAALSKSQANRLSQKIRETRLPEWVATTAAPYLASCLRAQNLSAQLRLKGDVIYLDYQPVTDHPAYVRSSVKLEFGARATGQPAEAREVTCYAAPHLQQLIFPTAAPQVMKVERTFWEKATAAHVFCRQARLRGEGVGYARHWHDLTRLEQGGYAQAALRDRELAHAVADHKTKFFSEKDSAGQIIDYRTAVDGGVQLAPEGDAYEILSGDYDQMIQAGLFAGDVEPFADLMARCRDLQARANTAAAPESEPAATARAPPADLRE